MYQTSIKFFYSKDYNKHIPFLIDFTPCNVTNCRKMTIFALFVFEIANKIKFGNKILFRKYDKRSQPISSAHNTCNLKSVKNNFD